MMQRSFLTNVLVLLCAVSLGACGGGDGGNGGAPTGTGNPNGGAPTNTNVVGGSIQGQALNLSGQVSTWAGLIPGTDGSNNFAHFSFPTGLATDGTDLYIADKSDNLIRKLSLGNTNNGLVSTVAGTGSPGMNNVGGLAQATFNQPYDVAIDPASKILYVADSGNNQIRMIDLNTSTVSLIAGAADGISGFADGDGTAAVFNSPQGLAFHDTGTTKYLYVADTGNHNIRQINLSNGSYTVTTIAGDTGTPATASSPAVAPAHGDLDSTPDANGILSAGTTAEFFSPDGIAYAGNKLFVADTNNNKIRIVDLGTTGDPVTTLAASANFSFPEGVAVAVDATGAPTTVYVADSVHEQISSIALDSTGAVTAVTVYAGNGNAGGTDNSDPSQAEFNYPWSLAVIGSDLYVSDNLSNTLRVVSATGVFTVAGFSSLNNPDGIYTTAQFSHPQAVTTDGNSLYVADTGSSKIRKVNMTSNATATAGQVSTLVDSSKNIIPTGLNSPLAITNDGTYLYITDNNGSVYKVQISNPDNTTQPPVIGLLSPVAITVLGSYLYVVESSVGDVKKINKNTMTITDSIASNLKNPQGITTDGTNLYVLESATASGYYAVDKIDMTQSSPVVSTLISNDTTQQSTTPNPYAMLYEPSGITCDGTSLYITTVNAVLQLNIQPDPQTGLFNLVTLAGATKHTVFGYTDSTANKSPLFDYPMGITTDGTSLYIADSRNNNIRLLQ